MSSDSDRLTRATAVILLISLLLPHTHLNSDEPMLLDLCLASIFLLIVYFFIGDCKRLYKTGGEGKLLVIAVIVTFFCNTYLSYIGLFHKWYSVPLFIWATILSYITGYRGNKRLKIEKVIPDSESRGSD